MSNVLGNDCMWFFFNKINISGDEKFIELIMNRYFEGFGQEFGKKYIK